MTTTTTTTTSTTRQAAAAANAQAVKLFTQGKLDQALHILEHALIGLEQGIRRDDEGHHEGHDSSVGLRVPEEQSVVASLPPARAVPLPEGITSNLERTLSCSSNSTYGMYTKAMMLSVPSPTTTDARDDDVDDYTNQAAVVFMYNIALILHCRAFLGAAPAVQDKCLRKALQIYNMASAILESMIPHDNDEATHNYTSDSFTTFLAMAIYTNTAHLQAHLGDTQAAETAFACFRDYYASNAARYHLPTTEWLAFHQILVLAHQICYPPAVAGAA